MNRTSAKTTTTKKRSSTKTIPKTTTQKNDLTSSKGLHSRTYFFIFVTLIVLLFAGFLLIPHYQHQQELTRNTYNHYPFQQWPDGTWSVNLNVNDQPFTVLLHYHPRVVDYIPASKTAVDLINALATQVRVTHKGKLYITVDPDANGGLVIAGVEIAKITGTKFHIYNIPTKAAFTRTKEGFEGTIPVITCNNATNDTFVIYIRDNQTIPYIGIAKEKPHCIIVQGTTTNETIKAADRFVYGLFNIIPPDKT